MIMFWHCAHVCVLRNRTPADSRSVIVRQDKLISFIQGGTEKINEIGNVYGIKELC